MNPEQEIQDELGIPLGFKVFMGIIGALLIALSMVVYCLSILGTIEYSPEELQVFFILSVGLVVLILPLFPWKKIKVGELEFEMAENAINEAHEDYSEVIEELKKELEEYKAEVQQTKPEFTATANVVETLDTKTRKHDEMLDLLRSFLQKWSTYGFNIKRIKNWGGKQSGFEPLGKLSRGELRMLADELVENRQARVRLSKMGSALYQIS